MIWFGREWGHRKEREEPALREVREARWALYRRRAEASLPVGSSPVFPEFPFGERETEFRFGGTGDTRRD